MKISIASITLLAFLTTAVPLTSHAFDWNVPWKKDKRTTMEKDKNGGYTEPQRDYKSKKKRTEEHKNKPGYYNGTYHEKSPEHRKHEWQFVD